MRVAIEVAVNAAVAMSAEKAVIAAEVNAVAAMSVERVVIAAEVNAAVAMSVVKVAAILAKRAIRRTPKEVTIRTKGAEVVREVKKGAITPMKGRKKEATTPMNRVVVEAEVRVGVTKMTALVRGTWNPNQFREALARYHSSRCDTSNQEGPNQEPAINCLGSFSRIDNSEKNVAGQTLVFVNVTGLLERFLRPDTLWWWMLRM